MRIVHVVDAAQAQAQVQQRIAPPPTISPPRRVQAINGQSRPDDPTGVGTAPPDDGISLALSPEAREAARKAAMEELLASQGRRKADPDDEASASEGEGEEQDAKIQEAVQELEQQDRRVRAHEIAHAAVAGSLGSAPTFTYTVGPDGHLYAVAGEVRIDTSPVPGDPEATLRKAQQIQAAAFAPGDPSPEDRRATVMASALAAQARQALARRHEEEEQPEGQPSPRLRKTG